MMKNPPFGCFDRKLYFRFCRDLGIIVFKGDLVGGIGGYFDRLPDKELRGEIKISEDKNTAKIPQPPKTERPKDFAEPRCVCIFERKGRLKAPTAKKDTGCENNEGFSGRRKPKRRGKTAKPDGEKRAPHKITLKIKKRFSPSHKASSIMTAERVSTTFLRFCPSSR